MIKGFHTGTFVVTLILSIVVAGLIFNTYTKKKYGEPILGKKV
jgi:hypothetical protein